jgi:hypothetical protein
VDDTYHLHHLLEQARRCRRLARSNLDAKVVATLEEMARECERQQAALQRPETNQPGSAALCEKSDEEEPRQ